MGITPFTLANAAAIRYLDPVSGQDGTGGHDGTTMALAWATWDYALNNSRGLGTGNLILQKGGTTWTTTASTLWGTTTIGTSVTPFAVAGYPRAAKASLGGDFTNGSNVVTNVTGITLTAANCMCRTLVPGGVQYMVGRMVSTTSFEMLQNYAGATATTAFSFESDDWYDELVRLGVWDVNNAPDDRATLTNGANAHIILQPRPFCHVDNLHFTNGGAGVAAVQGAGTCYNLCFRSLSVLQSVNTASGLQLYTYCYGGKMHHCSVVSTAASPTSYYNLAVAYGASNISILGNYVYNGGYCLIVAGSYSSYGAVVAQNRFVPHSGCTYLQVLIGDGFVVWKNNIFSGALVNVRTTANGSYEATLYDVDNLKAKRIFVGDLTKNTGDAAITVPVGYTDCLEILSNIAAANIGKRSVEDALPSLGMAARINRNRFALWLPRLTTAIRLKVNTQVAAGLTSAQLWIEAETTSTVFVKSSNSVAVAGNITDWTQDIHTADFTLAAAGWAYFDVFWSYYDVAAKTFLLAPEYRIGANWIRTKWMWVDAEVDCVMPESGLQISRGEAI